MKKLVKIFLISITVLLIMSCCAVFFAFGYLSKYKESSVDTSLLEISDIKEETHFYRYDFSNRQSRIGDAVIIEDAGLCNSVQYKFIPYPQIPQDLINAFIAIEDKRFFDHNGVDYLRSSKAAVNYLLKGSSGFGGSTITQHLVKNLTGEDEITSNRKIKEAFSAINLEREHDKSEIIEMYLNIINLSDGCRGIGAASEHFYSKEPYDLSLSECATIAAITNNQSKYNHRLNPENTLHRRDLILKCMLDLKYISQ